MRIPDWSNVDGPVTLKSYGRKTLVFVSFDVFILSHTYWSVRGSLTDNSGRAKPKLGYDPSVFLLQAEYSMSSWFILLDQHDLVIPIWRITQRAQELGRVNKHWKEQTRQSHLDYLIRAGWRPERDFRNGPLPGQYNHGGSHADYLRYVRTTQERRWAFPDPDRAEIGTKAGPRGKRSLAHIPTAWDDIPRNRERSWKRHRRTQYKVRD